ncbi:MAG: tRNA 2-thiouridine(34) synthase MnmA [Chloroflexi bacterium]|nr:tRNA 2-thiouridine(34) synthase MnmA [Chloroflexota bacterium]
MSQCRAVVAMSGGVDSSVAAYLLQRAGYEVIGVTMRLWSEEVEGSSRHNRQCCSLEDAQDARRVAQLLGFPHYVFNFEREFKAHVIDYFIREYSRGRTPHPCIACNDKIKFAFFLQRALALEADWIATGHYARRHETPTGIRLLKAVDAAKDQTYVLYGLTQQELRRTLFPVGELTKGDVRSIARELALPTAEKPDSQEICFVPSGDYRDYLQGRVAQQPGPILDMNGTALGTHQGVSRYTIGQRKGLPPSPDGRRLYVTAVDAEENTLIVGSEEELQATGLRASGASFLGLAAPAEPLEVTAKVRSKSPEAPAVLLPGPSGTFELRFKSPQRAVTPGQAVAVYRGEDLLGGGTIEQAWREAPTPLVPATA